MNSGMLRSILTLNDAPFYTNRSGIGLELGAMCSYWTGIDLLRPPYWRRAHCKNGVKSHLDSSWRAKRMMDSLLNSLHLAI